MTPATEIIQALGMQAHVEGGYWVRSAIAEGHPSAWSGIYFLLRRDDVSRLHVLSADELWLSHSGWPVQITQILPDGTLVQSVLGTDLLRGQLPQIVIRAGTVFGALVLADTNASTDDYSLLSCIVIPAFTEAGFSLCNRDDLLARYPQHADAILRLT